MNNCSSCSGSGGQQSSGLDCKDSNNPVCSRSGQSDPGGWWSSTCCRRSVNSAISAYGSYRAQEALKQAQALLDDASGGCAYQKKGCSAADEMAY